MQVACWLAMVRLLRSPRRLLPLSKVV